MAVCPELRGAGPSFSLSNLPPGPGAVPPWGSEFARRKEAETEDKGEERDLGEEVGGDFGIQVQWTNGVQEPWHHKQRLFWDLLWPDILGQME